MVVKGLKLASQTKMNCTIIILFKSIISNHNILSLQGGRTRPSVNRVNPKILGFDPLAVQGEKQCFCLSDETCADVFVTARPPLFVCTELTLMFGHVQDSISICSKKKMENTKTLHTGCC